MKKALGFIFAGLLAFQVNAIADGFAWGSGYQGASPRAENIRVDTDEFDGILSVTDAEVQTALETIDNLTVETLPTTLTQNSIPYVGAGGVLVENNPGLTYDGTNMALGGELNFDGGGRITGNRVDDRLDFYPDVSVSGNVFSVFFQNVVGDTTTDFMFQIGSAVANRWNVLEGYSGAGLAVGTGTLDPIEFYVNRTAAWTIETDNDLVSGTDGTADYDIVTKGDFISTATSGNMLSNESLANSDINIWRVGAASDNYGFYQFYEGSGSGNANALALWSENQVGADKQIYEFLQDGTGTFYNALTFSSNLTVDGEVYVGPTTLTQNGMTGYRSYWNTGSDVMFDQVTDNFLYKADIRFGVTQTNFSSASASSLFDQDYEESNNNTIASGTEAVLKIDLTDKGIYNTTTGVIYGTGDFYLTFYGTGGTGLDNLTFDTWTMTRDQSVTADNATDTFTRASHGLNNDDRVEINGTAIPTGITEDVKYYVVNKTTDTFQISATSGGAAVDFSDDGTSVVFNQWRVSSSVEQVNSSGKPIYKLASASAIYLVEFEIHITTDDEATTYGLVSVEYRFDRPYLVSLAATDKYVAQDLYYNWTWYDSSYVASTVVGTGGVTTVADVSVGDDLLFPNVNSVINFGSGDVTLSYTSNLLSLAGGTLTSNATIQAEHLYTTDDLEVGDDILLSTGGLINWNSGAVVLTDSGNYLKMGTGAAGVDYGILVDGNQSDGYFYFDEGLGYWKINNNGAKPISGILIDNGGGSASSYLYLDSTANYVAYSDQMYITSGDALDIESGENDITLIPGSGTVAVTGGLTATGTVQAEDLYTTDDLRVTDDIVQSSISRQESLQVTLIDGSAVTIRTFSLNDDDLIGGHIEYAIFVGDGTDFQEHTGIITFGAFNKAGTITSDIDEVYLAASETNPLSSGTLTDTWTIVDNDGSPGSINIQLNANTSLSGAELYMEYKVTYYTRTISIA